MLTTYVSVGLNKIMIHMWIGNANATNDSNNTTFHKSSFYEERHSYYYFSQLDSDILADLNIADRIHMKKCGRA